MRRGEFQIIDRFFTHDAFGEWRSQGVGDDCAILFRVDQPEEAVRVFMENGIRLLSAAEVEVK